MNNDTIKRDNRKAFPKFLLFMLVCMLLGGLGGFAAGIAGYSAMPDTIRSGLQSLLCTITPWGPLVCSLLLLIPAALLLHRSKTEYRSWDGEDEETADRIENRATPVVMLSNLNMLLDLFFLSSVLAFPRSDVSSPFLSLFPVACVLLSMGCIVFLQQRLVDLSRSMNPEKNGSVYDMKFQKKWLASCDEAERRTIGEASYRSFRATTSAGMVLWILLILGDTIFHFGLLPAFMVLVMMGVSQSSYLIAVAQLSRKKKSR